MQIEEAVQLLDSGKFDAAADAFTRIIARGSPPPVAFQKRAIAYEKLNRIKDARDDLLRTLDRSNPHPAALSNLARVRMKLNECDLAMKELNEGIAVVRPPSMTLYWQRAELFKQLGRFDDELADRLRAYECATGEKGKITSLAVLCDRMSELGRYKRAIQLWSELIQIGDARSNPQRRAEHLARRGLCYKASELWEDAISDFQAVLRINRSDIRTTEALAICCHRLARYEDAQKYYSAVIREEPKLPNLRYNRGIVSEELFHLSADKKKLQHLLSDAIADFEKALELYSAHGADHAQDRADCRRHIDAGRKEWIQLKEQSGGSFTTASATAASSGSKSDEKSLLSGAETEPTVLSASASTPTNRERSRRGHAPSPDPERGTGGGGSGGNASGGAKSSDSTKRKLFDTPSGGHGVTAGSGSGTEADVRSIKRTRLHKIPVSPCSPVEDPSSDDNPDVGVSAPSLESVSRQLDLCQRKIEKEHRTIKSLQAQIEKLSKQSNSKSSNSGGSDGKPSNSKRAAAVAGTRESAEELARVKSELQALKSKLKGLV